MSPTATRALAIALAACSTQGCVHCQKSVHPRAGQIRTGYVAVLPFRNGSNIVAAGDRCRAAALMWMQARGYVCRGIVQTDALLRTRGITAGGQLGSLPCEEIGKLTQADTILFGDVLKFNSYIFFLYNIHSIRVRLTLKAAKSLADGVHPGDTLWHVTASTSIHRLVSPLPIGMLIGVAQLVDDHQLRYETGLVVRKALMAVPENSGP